MGQELARLAKLPPGEEPLPRDLPMAWRHEKSSRIAYQERAEEAENAAAGFATEARTLAAAEASLRAKLELASEEARRQHRIGYLEARSKYGLGGMAIGLVLTAVVAWGSASFNSWRTAQQVRETVKASNEAFGQGIAVGTVRAEQQDDDRGLSRGREPADAPR